MRGMLGSCKDRCLKITWRDLTPAATIEDSPHPFSLSYCRYDEDQDKYLGLSDLKLMMEKLGVPQTHLGLKAMIKEVDEDGDGKISFREVRLRGCIVNKVRKSSSSRVNFPLKIILTKEFIPSTASAAKFAKVYWLTAVC